MKTYIYRQACQNWRDLLLVVTLATVVGFASYLGAQRIDPMIFDSNSVNIWFQSDISRVFSNMTDHKGNHYRTQVHPLFSLLAFPPVYALKTVLGIPAITAVRIVIAAIASLWISALFILLRLIGCHRFDATLFSVLGASSAASVFWLVVSETYSFGSLSILLALCFVVITQQRKLSTLWYVAVSAMTLSFTLTNWMVGILATLVNFSWKRSLQITANALLLVLALWTLQRFIFRSAGFFLFNRAGSFVFNQEKKYILQPDAGGPLQAAKSFIFHSMVMPTIKVVRDIDSPSEWSRQIMVTQPSAPGSASLWGTVAVVLWIALLGLGVWGLFSIKEHLKLRIVLGLTLLGQFMLHMLYGDETFLYSLHFAPLLVVLAAFSTLTRMRPLALVLASMLVLSAGINNGWNLIRRRHF